VSERENGKAWRRTGQVEISEGFSRGGLCSDASGSCGVSGAVVMSSSMKGKTAILHDRLAGVIRERKE
jgi:hypothetical protein